jgi:spore germination protein KB
MKDGDTLNEKIPAKQVIYLIVSFIFGSSIIIGINNNAEQDSWLSLFLAIAFILPVVLMYARIIKLNPEESLFDILEKLFGKIIGKIMVILMTWYAIHLGTLVICNFTRYINLSSLQNTPEILIAIVLLFITVYICRSPMSTFGKWGIVMLSAIVLILLMTFIIAIPNMEINHITPVLNHSFGTILGGALVDFSLPFAETVLFLCLGCFIKKSDNSYKIFITAILVGGIFLLVVFVRNLAVLGVNIMTDMYFPSFVTARVLQVGDFFTRIEGLITLNFIFAGVTKITVCLIAASKGIAKIINVKDNKDLILPTSLIFLAMSSIMYQNTLQMFDFLSVYYIYAFPFQILIPFIVWIASEIRNKKDKNKNKATNKLQPA